MNHDKLSILKDHKFHLIYWTLWELPKLQRDIIDLFNNMLNTFLLLKVGPL